MLLEASTESGWVARHLESPGHTVMVADPAIGHLKTWGEQITRRRGKRIAPGALGRRIAGILYAMWRDERVFGGERGDRAA